MNQSNTERVHGQWIKQNPMVDTEECSVCGYNILDEELETPFCPWCGSDMRDGDNMDDVIYRQDVLNLIPQDISDFEEGSCLAYDVGRLPSAQKKGHWIYKETVYEADECSCSECGQPVTTHKGKRMNFCPNCGADMRGDESG